MARRVILITGAPGAGKTTHAQHLAATQGLTHLEREQYPSDEAYITDVTTRAAQPDAQLAIVRCCTTLAERDEWDALTGADENHELDPGIDVCLARVRRRPGHTWRESAGIRAWYAARETR